MGPSFSPENFRAKFPILEKLLDSGKRLIYCDNLATTQKPACVINKIVDFYENYNANVHRGMYEISEKATDEYERTRSKIAKYFGVDNPAEFIFVRGTTEAINLVANTHGRKFLAKGDEILIGAAEHHANYLPWQVLEQEIGVVRKIIPLDRAGNIDMECYQSLFSKRTKLVAIQHISNVLGTVNDIKTLCEIAHGHGAKVLVDGACALACGRINLRDLDCDFFACSGHKGFGPTGSGILFGKYPLLRAMPPYNTGGNGVNVVSFDGSSFKPPPDRFEVGTPDIAAVIGLGATVDFLERLDWASAWRYLDELTRYLGHGLGRLPGVKIYGHAANKICVFSFNLEGVHCHDVATYLGNEGIAVRAGTHCAQPLMQHLGVPGSVRISMTLYNTREEVDKIVDVLGRCQAAFR
jgi:cysteine desulfurase/selenocysteine lyase